jgi:hypothetical protein
MRLSVTQAIRRPRMDVSEKLIRNAEDGNSRSLIQYKYYPSVCLQELRRTVNNLSQARPCPGRESHPPLPQNKPQN